MALGRATLLPRHRPRDAALGIVSPRLRSGVDTAQALVAQTRSRSRIRTDVRRRGHPGRDRVRASRAGSSRSLYGLWPVRWCIGAQAPRSERPLHHALRPGRRPVDARLRNRPTLARRHHASGTGRRAEAVSIRRADRSACSTGAHTRPAAEVKRERGGRLQRQRKAPRRLSARVAVGAQRCRRQCGRSPRR